MGQALEMCVRCETKRSCDTCTDLHNWIMEHLEPKQEWISVKDRLPEQRRDVLIYLDNYGIECMTIGVYDESVFGECWYANMMEFPVSSVTHWMPLPEPPETE